MGKGAARNARCAYPFPYFAAGVPGSSRERAGLGAQNVSEHAQARTPGKCRPRCWPIRLPLRDRGAFGAAAILLRSDAQSRGEVRPRRRGAAGAILRGETLAERERRNHGGSRVPGSWTRFEQRLIQARFSVERVSDRTGPDGAAAASAGRGTHFSGKACGESQNSLWRELRPCNACGAVRQRTRRRLIGGASLVAQNFSPSCSGGERMTTDWLTNVLIVLPRGVALSDLGL